LLIILTFVLQNSKDNGNPTRVIRGHTAESIYTQEIFTPTMGCIKFHLLNNLCRSYFQIFKVFILIISINSSIHFYLNMKYMILFQDYLFSRRCTRPFKLCEKLNLSWLVYHPTQPKVLVFCWSISKLSNLPVSLGFWVQLTQYVIRVRGLEFES
jgi:hypothetical protein